MFQVKDGIALVELRRAGILQFSFPFHLQDALDSFLGHLVEKLENHKSRPIYSWRNCSPIKMKWLGQGYICRGWGGVEHLLSKETQKGRSIPVLKSGLLSNAQKWIVLGDTCAGELREFTRMGAWAESNG